MASPYTPPGIAGRNTQQFAEAVDRNVARAFESIYGRTAAEIAAGVTPVNFQFPEGNAHRYGAVGDGIADDTAALRAMCNVIQERGGGVLSFGSGRYRIYENTSDTDPIGQFSGLRGVTIEADGAELVIDRDFADVQQIRIFEFSNCDHIQIDNIKASCAGTRSDLYQNGPELFVFLGGCTNIHAWNVEGSNLRLVVQHLRELTDTAGSRNSVWTNIKATNTGYGLLCTDSGSNIRANLSTDGVGRSAFIHAGSNIELSEIHLTVISKNHDATGDVLLQAEAGGIISAFSCDYTDTETTVEDNTRNHVLIEFEHETASVIRNGVVRLNIRREGPSGYSGFGCVIRKLDNNNGPDNTDRGHILENICISGVIKSITSNQRSINFCADGTWGTGEFVDQIHIRDLRLEGTGQPNFTLTALQGVATFTNVQYVDGPLNITGNTTGRIVCVGCRTTNFTVSSADASRQTYVGCEITSSTNQAFDQKNFIACRLSGYSDSFTHIAVDGQLNVPVIATANLPAAGSTMNGAILIEDGGVDNRNLIIYAGGQRFRIDGGLTF